MPPLFPRDRRLESSDDPRDESSSPDTLQESLLLRPLTSEARLGQCRLSLDDDTMMPPIFPAPLSVQGTKPPEIATRRTFLPHLVGARTTPDVATLENPEDHPENEDTDAFKQAMWAGQANILVVVRVRPSCAHDRDNQEIVRVIDNKLIVVLDKNAPPSSPQRVAPEPLAVTALSRRSTVQGQFSTGSHGLRKLRNVASAHPGRIAGVALAGSKGNQTANGPTRSREKRYAFDYVFTPHDGQQTVYRHTTKFLIHGVLNGFNATVFAYGCTGAGKTYTMLGTPDEPGIMALTLDDLFQNIAKVHTDPHATVVYKVTVSFLEVYNENIRDLLVTPPPFGGALSSMGVGTTSEFLDLREDPVKGPVVAGISEVEASNAQDVMKLLRRGNKHRSQEATAANAVSSRSHAVLQVLIEQRDKNSSSESFGIDASRGGLMTSTVKYGKLSLVDLAGSERAAVTQNRGQRLIEGANINRSLLALGNCINALGEKGAGATSGGFVPYRDSKLTRLLKDSLGGNCRTVMIANISPSTASVEETLNTLKYANRAKNIKTTVTRNVLNVDHHLTEYAGVVAELKDEIASLKMQLALQTEGEGGMSAMSPRLFGKKTSPERSGQGREPVVTTNNDDNPAVPDTEDAWKQAKLAEARGYIVQCFQQRQRLQQSLLEIDHCIDELSRQLKLTKDEKSKGPEVTEGGTEKQRDLATSILEDIIADSSHQQVESVPNSVVHETPDTRLEAGIRQLVNRKAQLVAQLERNQSVMDDFRHGIEQSPLFETNELLRDVLLMEYRVGDLQVENAIFSMRQKLKDHQLAMLHARLRHDSTNTSPLEPSDLCRALGDLPPLELPAPFTEMTRLLSATSTKRDPDEMPELQSTRSTGFAFLDELRDRFYDRKQPPPQLSRSNEIKTVSTQGGLSPRRQWGIHLNNTSLPYIRLKKKTSPPTVLAASTSPIISEYPSGSSSDSPFRLGSNGTTAAPYLKVLKHRRKLQHRSSTSSNSHKKLPGLQATLS